MGHDPVNHPAHYTGHPSGVECIQVVEHMGFCLGNAVKYIWRAGQKGDAAEDLRKARWYLDREIARIEGRPTPAAAPRADESHAPAPAATDVALELKPGQWVKFREAPSLPQFGAADAANAVTAPAEFLRIVTTGPVGEFREQGQAHTIWIPVAEALRCADVVPAPEAT